MLTTTIKMILARRFRLVTTAFAVLIGVAFMAGTMTLTDSVTKSFDRLFVNVYAGTDGFVRSTQTTGSQARLVRAPVPAELVATVGQVDGVAAAAGWSQGYAQLLNKAGKTFGHANNGNAALGFNWVTAPGLNPFRLAHGRPPAAADEIVIDQGSAKAAGYRLGDTATVMTEAPPQRFRIVGIATFGGADSAAGSSAVLFTPAEAQRLVGHPGEFDAVSVSARPGLSQAELAHRISRVLPAGTEVLTGKAVTAEAQRSIRQAVGGFGAFLLAFALIALFVGSFVIYNTFTILVAQRSREHGLLRAIGASRRQILVAVVGEALAVGVIASAAGIAAGFGIAFGLKALLAGFGVTTPSGGLALSARTVVSSVGAGVGVSLASAFFPARKAAKVAPIAALHDAAVDTPSGIRRRAVSGLVVGGLGVAAVAAGLIGHPRNAVADVGAGAVGVFVGVAILAPLVARPLARLLGAPLAALGGAPGELGRQNAMRNPKRTSATAASLMIGVALVGSLTVFASSAKRSFRASVDIAFKGNFVVNSAVMDQGGFPPQLEDAIGRVPGVKAAAGYRSTFVQIGAATMPVVGIDPVAYPQLFDLHVTTGRLENLGADGMAVVDTLAKSHGWRLGDRIPVRFAATGTQRLILSAIFTEKIQAPAILVPLAVYQANVAKQFDMTIYVATKRGADSKGVRAGLEAATAGYPTAKVETRSQYVADQLGMVNKLLGLVYVLLGFGVVIALMGIATTLGLSIHERTRELGLLRAVGMTRRQLRATVRYEAVIIALLGTVMGLGIGLGFGWALVRAAHNIGIGRLTIPASQLAAIVAVGAVAGVLAAALPARRAARLNLLKAIATG